VQEERFVKSDSLGRRRVIYIDNATSHNMNESLENIMEKLKFQIRYLEANTTDLCQPADSFVIKQIKQALDEYVRPAVESDGGAITFHSFDEASGQVKVLLQGSCSGCPSSTMTLKQGIEALLTRMVPGVKEVVAEGV
jgi:Fe-S cluster biogenesis protein NfuA